MNLSRVLDESLPDVPAARLTESYPRIHPRLVARLHEEHEGPIYIAVIPGGRPPHYFRLPPLQYTLVQLFDGQRSYEKVTELARQETGLPFSVQEIRDFANLMDKFEFWYRTPQEESALMCHELLEQRKKRLEKKREWGDLSTVILLHFDPDKYLDWVHKWFAFLFSRWFTTWSFFMLGVAGLLLVSRWSEVWRDSVEFYTLTGRGGSHILQFFLIFLLLGAFHETAHGLTCKHFGGEVHRMGVMMVYLAPAIFCDVSQAWAYGGRFERMATAAAGVWSELVVASYAVVVWWATPPGTLVHQAAYLTILSGGILCAALNWNPLSKLDGYYLICEYFRIFDLKGVSTAYVVAWLRKYVFHLPATIPALTPWRRAGYAAYALASGGYCYFILLFFVRLLYHIVHFYSPQWAFVPAGALAYVIFESRIKELGQFMKELYLDKKALLRAHSRPISAAALALLLLSAIPIWRERVSESFLLEPAQRAVLRAQVPGRVMAVLADEGQPVSAGGLVVRLRDVSLDSRVAAVSADYRLAAARATDAQLHYGDYGAAQQQRERYASAYQLVRDEQQHTLVRSPISGIVVTPRVHDLVGSYLAAGTQIAEVADTSTMRARIFVPEPEMSKLVQVDHAVLRPEGSWLGVRGKVISISPASEEPEVGLRGARSGYQGMETAEYFAVTVALPNADGRLRDGMTGTANIYGRRRPLLFFMFQPVIDAAARRLW